MGAWELDGGLGGRPSRPGHLLTLSGRAGHPRHGQRSQPSFPDDFPDDFPSALASWSKALSHTHGTPIPPAPQTHSKRPPSPSGRPHIPLFFHLLRPDPKEPPCLRGSVCHMASGPVYRGGVGEGTLFPFKNHKVGASQPPKMHSNTLPSCYLADLNRCHSPSQTRLSLASGTLLTRPHAEAAVFPPAPGLCTCGSDAPSPRLPCASPCQTLPGRASHLSTTASTL